MKKITIDWFDLETAFNQPTHDFSPEQVDDYFDKETGQVVTVDGPTREILDAIWEDLEKSGIDGANWTELDACRTPAYEAVPDCSKANVLSAIELFCSSHANRFEPIPQINSHQQFKWLEAFTETVPDDVMRKQLLDALNMRKPFRNFYEVLASDRRLQQKWDVYQAACEREAIIQWLHSIEVEPLNADASIYDPPPLPDLRKIMFAEVRRFVLLARDIPGVQRLALIGSLTTAKEFPKDIDLLVTIADDCDLPQLAKLGRQLAGHMVADSAGADVFLANPADQYLGRTCPWKRCGRGIRQSCDAISCGKRHYLHDDLKTICLSTELIKRPPVELWPNPTPPADIPPDLPKDLIEQLLQPLSENK